MTGPHPSNKEYRDELVRLAELTVTSDLLEDLAFRNCTIVGPAVIAILDDNTISHCRFDAPDANALFWVVPPDRQIVVGAIGIQNCSFQNCRFQMVGFAGPQELKALFESGSDS